MFFPLCSWKGSQGGRDVPLFFSEKSKPNRKKWKLNKQGWGLRKEVKPDPLPGLESLLRVPHEGFPQSSSGLLNRFLGVFLTRVSEPFSVFRRANPRDFLVPWVNPDYLERLQHTLSIGRRVRKETQELRGENLPCDYRGSQPHLCLHEPEGDTLSPSFH